MNWGVFAAATWVFFGLELGLRSALEIGTSGVAPSFVIPFAVFIALWAPTNVGAVACLLLGLLVDLTWLVPTESGGAAIAGPHALGFFLMAHLVAAARSIIIRRNPLTLVALSVVGSIVVHVVVVALVTLHTVIEPLQWAPTAEIVRRLGSSVYTGVVALAVALIAYPLVPIFGFPHSTPGPRFTSRRE